MRQKHIAIFTDSKKRSGGAYQELLYTIKNFKKYNDKYKISIIFSKKNLDINLTKFDLSSFNLNLNNFQRYVCFLRNNNSLIRRLKKFFFFKNYFEKFIKSKKIDLIYFAGPSQYASFLENTKYAITVPDVNHRENLEFPEIVDDSEFERKEEIFSRCLSKAIFIVTNAKIIKERICYFYRVLEDRVVVINHEPSLSISNFINFDKKKMEKIKNELGLPTNYLFYPAMYLPHKNHKNLFKALDIIKNKNKILNLVCCGNDIGYLKSLKNYVQSKKLEDQILFLDFIKDEYLPYLYNNCSMLVMTSLIGPTNIPPWEAFRLKRPVIYPNLEGIKEVLGDAVLYIDPLNPENIAKGILEITENKNLSEQLIKKGNEKIQEIINKEEFKEIIKKIDRFFELKNLSYYF